MHFATTKTALMLETKFKPGYSGYSLPITRKWVVRLFIVWMGVMLLLAWSRLSISTQIGNHYYSTSPFTKSSFYSRPAINCRSLNSSTDHDILGKHYMVDMYQVNAKALRNLETASGIELVTQFIKQSHMTVLDVSAHLFPCGGVTAVWLLSESHVSIHTWPEKGFIAIDVYTCGAGNPGKIVQKFEQYLQPQRQATSFIARGSTLRPDQTKLHHQVTTEILPMNQKQTAHDKPLSHNKTTLGYQRDITFIKGHDANGHVLADICINGDNIQDDCLLLKNTTLLSNVDSPFQRIEIIDTDTFGLCMLLDRVTQFCESDNHIYTDQLITRALDHFAAGAVSKEETSPKINVQIIGGGDGWVPAAILDRYSHIVQNITIVDIDPMVSEMTRRYFKPAGLVDAFKDNRVHWVYADANQWLSQSSAKPGSVDIVIIDCTDHTAEAAKVLYTRQFYENIHKLLKPGGIVAQQMNTESEAYDEFMREAERVWIESGLTNIQKWTAYIPSFMGESVFWMASR